MEYELYWGSVNSVPTKMVVSGSFGKIDDARKTAYRELKHIYGRDIDIVGIDRNGNLYDMGSVKRKAELIYYKDTKGRKYNLNKDGKIRRM